MLRYLTETDQHFIFQTDDPALKLDENGFKADEGTVWFDKDSHPDTKSCIERFERFKDNKAMKELQTHTKELGNTFTKSTDITDEAWRRIQKQMIRPDRIKREEVVSYEDWLAHNFADRDKERFPKAMLDNFNRTIVGKSKMIGHTRDGDAGEGVYYQSRMERLSVDDTLDMIQKAGGHPDPDIRKHLEHVQDKDGGVWWLVADFYMLTDNMPLIRQIDAGIKKKSSIAFGAEKRIPVEDDNGNVLYYEYVGRGEGREGSIVWLESQYGAAIQKDAGTTEPAKEETHETDNHKPGGKNMSSELKIEKLGIKISIDPEKLDDHLSDAAKAVTEKVDEIQEQLDEASKTIDGVKSVFGDDFSTEGMKVILDGFNEMKSDLVDETVKYLILNKLLEDDEAKIKERKALLMGQSVKEIKLSLAENIKVHEERNPAKGELGENNDTEDGGKKKELSLPDRHYRQIRHKENS